MAIKYSNIKVRTVFAALLLVFVLSFTLAYAQQKKAPDSVVNRPQFKNPQGRPDQSNAPDKSGKFKKAIVTNQKQSQLMNPTHLPQAEVRRFLIIVGVISAALFYIFFLHKRMKFVGAFAGNIAEKVDSYTVQNIAKSSGSAEKVSNASIIEEMVVKIEREKSDKAHSFSSFSVKNAFLPPPDTKNWGIDSWKRGAYLLLTDSAKNGRMIAMNLLHDTARYEQPVLFTSSRFSEVEVAERLIALEQEKPWNEMDETERYRISRLVEEFVEKYSHLFIIPGLSMREDYIKKVLHRSRDEGKISAFIIDDFSGIRKMGKITDDQEKELLDLLLMISRREGFPLFFIDRDYGSLAEKYSDKFVEVLEADVDDEDDVMIIRKADKKDREISRLSLDTTTGKLETSAAGAR